MCINDVQARMLKLQYNLELDVLSFYTSDDRKKKN